MSGDMNFRPGVQAKDDKLLVFKRDSVTVIRAWDQPAGWTKNSKRPYWQHCRPNIDLGMQRLLQAEKKAAYQFQKYEQEISGKTDSLQNYKVPWPIYNLKKIQRTISIYKAFFEQIPPPIRAAITPFQDRHFHLLSFCARCPGSLDLIHSTPAIAYMLANSWVFGPNVKQPLRSVRKLLRKKQRQQLMWLEFVYPGESSVKILRKIDKEQCSVSLLLYLRRAMADPELLKLLSHLPRINLGVVRIVSDPELVSWASPTLLEEIALLKSENTKPNTAYELRYIQENGFDIRPTCFRSRHHLHERLNWLNEHGNLHYPANFQLLEFPQPPVKGTEEIIPICTPSELIQEGREQKHCIGGYAPQIAKGHSYAYRISLPFERATALIAPRLQGFSKLWVLTECYGRQNAPVKEETIALIQAWLTSQQGVEVYHPEISHNAPINFIENHEQVMDMNVIDNEESPDVIEF